MCVGEDARDTATDVHALENSVGGSRNDSSLTSGHMYRQ